MAKLPVPGIQHTSHHHDSREDKHSEAKAQIN